MRTLLGVGVGAWLALAGSAGGSAGACSRGAEFVQPETPAVEFANADELLTALETADRGLHRLSAGVEYTKVFQPDGDMHVRIGSLFFTAEASKDGPEAPPHRRFAVDFTEFYRGDRKEEDEQIYAFDGQWLMEKHPDQKSFHLRQVVGPGETFDPLKIGQGPFPLPIGQKKADILAEYDATLLPAADGLVLEDPENAPQADRKRAEVLTKFVEGCWQVRLTPKAGLDAAADFSEVRLWYSRGEDRMLLPRMARTVAATDSPEVQGDIGIVRLIKVKVNEKAEIRPEVFDVKPPKDWEGQVDELPKAGNARRTR
jgi:hypothetical protein